MNSMIGPMEHMAAFRAVADPQGDGKQPETVPSGVLERAEATLRAVLQDSEREMSALPGDFQELARETDAILQQASKIAGYAESDAVASVLPAVQSLGSATRAFLEERLAATGAILDGVTAEAVLLTRLSSLTRGQSAIVRETEVLRVLTNIEVARLGEVGAGFRYLAKELEDFSQTVSASVSELMNHIEQHRNAIVQTRKSLNAELPRRRQEFARMQGDLEAALLVTTSAMEQMRTAPVRFRDCVAQIAGYIAGVVSAVQGHDITRQQTEHVCENLSRMAPRPAGSGADAASCFRAPEMRAGLQIQRGQLRNIRETARTWTEQIRQCLEAVSQVAESEIGALGPKILEQEQSLAAQLKMIGNLERECRAGDEALKQSLGGIARLMQLVREHLDRSVVVRDRLQLLMFNSIIEASHLGTKADGILEISTTIKRISSEWSAMTKQSEQAMEDILGLVERSSATMRALGETDGPGLKDAQTQTAESLSVLREAARCADAGGSVIRQETAALRAGIESVGQAAGRLDRCFGQVDIVLDDLETAETRLAASLQGAGDADPEEMERAFGAQYTTERERAILRAALRGDQLPEEQQSFAGNEVELF